MEGMKSLIPACLLSLLLALPAGAQIVLIDEDFSYSNPPDTREQAIEDALNAASNPAWFTVPDQSPNPNNFEGFGSSEANARGFSSQYDPGGGLVNIPGALEVNSNNAGLGQMIVVASFTLPNIDTSVDATLTFWGGIRTGGGDTPTITVNNNTESTNIFAQQDITGLNTGSDGSTTEAWVQKSYDVTFAASDIGDTIYVEWYGGGNNDGNGLLLVDIDFTATAIPEPSTYALIFGGLALTGFVIKRRLKSAS